MFEYKVNCLFFFCLISDLVIWNYGKEHDVIHDT